MSYDPKAQRRFEDIAEELAGRGVTVSKMFGMPCYKARGKALAGLTSGSGMVFKLPPEGVEEAVRLKGAEHFDPGMGRPMKEWIVLPLPHAGHWKEFAELALGYVAGGTA